MRSNNIIATTLWEPDRACLDEDGDPLIEKAADFLARLSRQLAPPDVTVFARPEHGISKLRGAEILTWSTHLEGVFRPFDSLSQEELRTAESLLRDQLHRLASVSDDRLKADIRRAVCVPEPTDLFFNGEAVVLISWAMKSDHSDASSTSQAMTALAPYLGPDLAALAESPLAPEAGPAFGTAGAESAARGAGPGGQFATRIGGAGAPVAAAASGSYAAGLSGSGPSFGKSVV